jgi:ABC-2 type transport system ATP-binding protein
MRRGAIEAVRGIELDVAPGEVFAVFGPEGAGKTSLVELLCTLARPTAGFARVAGFVIAADPLEVRRRIGVVLHRDTLDGDLSAQQNLRFHAELHGLPHPLAVRRAEELLAIVGLAERRAGPVHGWSRGMKRRLELARAVLHGPRVLFLDEPTSGLDRQARGQFWSYVRALKRRAGFAVFVATRDAEEAEGCDRVALVDAGRVVALGTPQALKAVVDQDRIELRTANDVAAMALLQGRLAIAARLRDGALSFCVEEGECLLPWLFAELGVPIRSAAVSRPTLDDVLAAHAATGGSSAPGGSPPT